MAPVTTIMVVLPGDPVERVCARLFGDKDGLLDAVAEHEMTAFVAAKTEAAAAAATATAVALRAAPTLPALSETETALLTEWLDRAIAALQQPPAHPPRASPPPAQEQHPPGRPADHRSPTISVVSQDLCRAATGVEQLGAVVGPSGGQGAAQRPCGVAHRRVVEDELLDPGRLGLDPAGEHGPRGAVEGAPRERVPPPACRLVRVPPAPGAVAPSLRHVEVEHAQVVGEVVGPQRPS